jgi:hypothetical protein
MSVRTHGLIIVARYPGTVAIAPTASITEHLLRVAALTTPTLEMTNTDLHHETITVYLLRVAAMTTPTLEMTNTDLHHETAEPAQTLQSQHELRGPGGTISERHHPGRSVATAATLKATQRRHAAFSTSNSCDAWVDINSNLLM